jgi:hypothetical protein
LHKVIVESLQSCSAVCSFEAVLLRFDSEYHHKTFGKSEAFLFPLAVLFLIAKICHYL